MTNIKALCATFKARADGMNMKGKKRDDAAVEFFCGAVAAYDAAGMNDDARHVERVTAMLICTRGYQYIEQTIKEG